MIPVGFEPTISAGELPQTYSLDRAAIGTGASLRLVFNFLNLMYIKDKQTLVLNFILTYYGQMGLPQ